MVEDVLDLIPDLLPVIVFFYLIRYTIISLVRSYRAAQADRARYYSMSVPDREAMVKSVLYVLKNKEKLSSANVASSLDLKLYTADEAISRLQIHGSSKPAIWQLI